MNNSDKPGDSKFPLTNNAPRASKPAVAPIPASAPPRRPHPFLTFLKRALVVCFCLLSLVGGTVMGSFYQKSSMIRAVVSQMFTDPFHPLDFTPEKQFPGVQQLNVMLLGCDVDYEPDKPVVRKDTNGRSDAIMVAHFDFVNNTIKVLSIPRDTAVRIPGHGVQKINAAHAFGGPALTAQTIKECFSIPTDNYLTLNFVAFQKVVDAVGGVDLTVHKELNYDDNWGNLHIHLHPGFQHMNGYKAMGYVRIRHTDDDLARAERQHEFLEALRSRVTNLANFRKLPDVLNAITDNMKHDMTDAQMLALANFARQRQKGEIMLATMPSDEGPSYVYTRREEARKVIADTFYNGDESQVNLDVLNRRTLMARSDSARRRHRRRHPVRTSAAVPRDDNGNPLVDDSPQPDDGALAGNIDAHHASSDTRDAAGSKSADNPPAKSAEPSKPETAPGDSGSKDSGGKDGGAKDPGSDPGKGAGDMGANQKFGTS